MPPLSGFPGQPGQPGNLGQPATGSDLSLDLPTPGSGALIVNRTLYIAPIENIGGTDTEVIQDGVAVIPPTTAGNTLIVVGMSGPVRNFVSFNGVQAGQPLGWPVSFDDQRPINTPDNGFTGSAGPYPNGYNVGSTIAYWTNIPGGISAVHWDLPINGLGPYFTPTRAMIYELSPCTVIDIKGTGEVDFIDGWPIQNPPSMSCPPVNGPDAGGLYIASILYEDAPSISGSFVGVSSGWEIDYQETVTAPVNIRIAGAVAFLRNGSGSQSCSFTWDGSSANPAVGLSSIALLPRFGAGGGSDAFQPNTFIIT